MGVLALLSKVPYSLKAALVIALAAKALVFCVGYAASVSNGDGSLAVLLSMFNRWDAPHYVDIARDWYVNAGDAANFIVFFPLYPVCVRLVTFDFAYASLSALLVANLSSLVAFVYLYKLAVHEFSEGVAVKAVLFLSLFPTAYFLSAPYTEGLFFALTIASIYYARLGKWQLAGMLGLLSALTRIAGLLLLPTLLVEYLHQKRWKPKNFDCKALWAALPLTGFLMYLGINYQATANPFMFLEIQRDHWNNVFAPLTGLTQAYSWAVSGAYPANVTIGVAPIVFGVFGLLMVGLGVWRRLRPVYLVYMFLSWGLAVSTSWWISVPRYIMALFPMFMLLGLVAKREITVAVIAGVFVVGLCYFTGLFAVGQWAF
ncbi:MAG: mannosyltransferase family protein [Candidatus Bathyarchaeota archaeon]|nr:mannosyltransferase family protein [Candidatus Bathyarchaeota archaeon]